MIKNLRLLIPVICMIVSMSCRQNDPTPPPRPELDKIAEWLQTVPGVKSVQELDKGEYAKRYLIVFEQLIDPKNPAAGTFTQRVTLNHVNFDSPVVYETYGYNIEGAVIKYGFANELTKRYNANMVVVEYRYSGGSIPSARDWKYLTCENAAADLHAVRKALGEAYTGKWIATGASKGGTTSMFYTMYYPEDLAATVAYVGPICNDLKDQRFVTHMRNVATPEMRKQVTDFQREMLKRRNVLQPHFLPNPPESTGARKIMTNDQSYDQSVLDFLQGYWQYGAYKTESGDQLPLPAIGASDQEMIDYMTRYVFVSTTSSAQLNVDDPSMMTVTQYLRRLKNQTKNVDGVETDNMHYYVQVLAELGNYAFWLDPVADLIPDYPTWSANLVADYIVPASAADIVFSSKLRDDMNNWLRSNDPRLICVYGEYDPWTAAAPEQTYFTGKSNMVLFVAPQDDHGSKITKLSGADSQSAFSKLDSWVK